jgi:heme exporter protein A
MSIFTGENLFCIRAARPVFGGLDFTLRQGGALILVGPNGSGKSSLLRLMAGLSRPAEGRLCWDGEDVADDRVGHNERIRYLGHLDPVKPVLSVAENLSFWAAGEGAPAALAALAAFGIRHLADVPGRYLSAGQKRRVNLARLLVRRSPLWLLDEPTTALDRDAVGMLADVIAGHRAGGGMVAVSTHAELALPGAAVLDLSDFPAFTEDAA